jgi:hypothetical protein
MYEAAIKLIGLQPREISKDGSADFTRCRSIINTSKIAIIYSVKSNERKGTGLELLTFG